MNQIYLDFNSTTPIDPEVAEAISECYRKGYVNPASQHRSGQQARRILEQNRSKIVELLGGCSSGMQTDTLILTSGGTEANNLALRGLLGNAREGLKGEGLQGDRPPRLLVSSVEHPSVLATAEFLARSPAEKTLVEQIPVDRYGVVDLDRLAQMMEQPTALVSVMLANNETGVIQPIAEIVRLCREKGVLVHSDAVQGVGKMDVHFRDLGLDAMTLTAHKLHGPRGVGGLLVKHGVTIHPQLFGGFQQMAVRPGTEDVALTVGLCRALENFVNRGPTSLQSIETKRDQLQELILAECSDVVINGHADHVSRVPHTLNLSFRTIDRQAFLLAADMAGLAISTGSACASGSSEPSHVLEAMGVAPEVVRGSIRISLGATTTEQEIENSARRIIKISKDLG